MKQLIKNYTKNQLEEILVHNGFPAYRSSQIFRDVFIRRVDTFEAMKTLPKKLQKFLNENFIINSLELDFVQTSKDGTRKMLFKMRDGSAIESVIIPEFKPGSAVADHYTLCVSTQSGCRLNCAFCATAKIKFRRNLETAEIIDQLFLAEKVTGLKISNIVYMGMGEPLLNYDNVVNSIKMFIDEKCKIVSKSKITLSTVGIVPEIIELAEEKLGIKLAISLHATDNQTRRKLVPANSKYPLRDILDAVEHFYRLNKTPITFEYILFNEINDTDNDILKLVKITRRVSSKVNLLKYHDIDFRPLEGFSLELKASPPQRMEYFISALKKHKVKVFLRSSSGLDIDAACGQLAFSRRMSLF